MPVILLRLPSIKTTPLTRPLGCPHCGSQVLQRWGRSHRSVYDQHNRKAEVHRYRCSECGRTFRKYPAGVDQSTQTQRIRYLAALAWVLGLSYRDIANFLQKNGIKLSHTTVWRDRQRLLDNVDTRSEEDSSKRYALDTNFVLNISPKLGIVVVIDLGDGKREILGTIDEFNPRNIKSWLESVVDDVNIEVIQLNTNYLYQC
ncbi:MAG: hypothetical protein P8X95_07220 [Anaerolineales bacterium]|jgi:DNA-directed RNA polymerase subunit RPC12/RpoP